MIPAQTNHLLEPAICRFLSPLILDVRSIELEFLIDAARSEKRNTMAALLDDIANYHFVSGTVTLYDAAQIDLDWSADFKIVLPLVVKLLGSEIYVRVVAKATTADISVLYVNRVDAHAACSITADCFDDIIEELDLLAITACHSTLQTGLPMNSA